MHSYAYKGDMMKTKIMVLLIISILLVFSNSPSMLSETAPRMLHTVPVQASEQEQVPESFFSWSSAGTLSGAVAMVAFIVHMMQLPLNETGPSKTKYIVYAISAAVLLFTQFMTSDHLNATNISLTLLNAGIVCASVLRILKDKKKNSTTDKEGSDGNPLEGQAPAEKQGMTVPGEAN